MDLDAFARWVLADLPRHVHETPYDGIACHLAEPLPTDLVEAAPRSPADAAGTLRRALERAVARAVGSARRVAVLTGGGVDSGALLGLAVAAARERGGSAFAVALDYRAEGDDRPHLSALEQHLGCEVVRVAPEDAAARADLVRGVDAAPFGSPTGQIEIEAFTRARENGAELVLTGAGGDDLFDGVPHALADLAREGHWPRAIREARSVRGFDVPRSPVFSWVVRPLLAPLLPASLRMWRARRARPSAPAWAGRVLRASVEAAWRRYLDELDEELAGHRRPEASPTALQRTWVAWYRHQQEVVAGIERSDPYLDRGLVASVQSLPPSWLVHGGVRRGLFREAIRGLVPDSLRTREDKAAFEPAMFRFVESIGGFASLRDLARVPHLAELGFVEPDLFGAAFEQFAASPIGSSEWGRIWPALCAEAFLKERSASRDR